MSDHALSSAGLRASRVNWKRLRQLGLQGGLIVGGVVATTMYYQGGIGALVLRADGVIMRDHTSITAPFESRVSEVLVRPGQYVTQGQTIALVHSPAINRTMADLAAEKARLITKIAELAGREQAIIQILPRAKMAQMQSEIYLVDLAKARTSGLAVNRSMQEFSAASLSAFERVAALTAEQVSVPAELAANQAALNQLESAMSKLNSTYADGVLTANATGYIGGSVASVGDVLTSAGKNFADVYTGVNYVLAYLPDSYRRDIVEGQNVRVSTPTTVMNGMIDRILPIADTLPGVFQQPNKAPTGGRLVRVELTDANSLPINQRVEVSGCWANDCRKSLPAAVVGGVLAKLNVAWEAALDARNSLVAKIGDVASDRRLADAGTRPVGSEALQIRRPFLRNVSNASVAVSDH